MNEQEIRDNAPLGATHYGYSFIDGSIQYIKLENDLVFKWTDYDSMSNRWRLFHGFSSDSVSHFYKPLP